MLTAQEIKEMSFEKAVFGGYDSGAVDEFMEQIIEDYTTMQKENISIKSKMKVMLDKIEEYRSVEDGMRKALLTAESIARDTVENAKKEADQIIVNGKSSLEQELLTCKENIILENQKLEDIKIQNSEFVAKLKSFCNDQIALLNAFSRDNKLNISSSDIKIEIPSPIVSSDAEVSSEKEEVPQQNYTIPEDIRKFMTEKTEKAEKEDGLQFKMMEVKLSDADQGETKKSKFTFGDLKFGSDYKE